MPALIDTLLGSTPVTPIFRRVSSSRLRVLAYHGVPDSRSFETHLDLLQSQFNVVSGAEVAAAFTRGAPLPPRAVWITFDDGLRDVVTNGLPLLKSRGIIATAFICPGVAFRGTPLWWRQVPNKVPAATLADFPDLPGDSSKAVAWMKTVPDATRRAVLRSLQNCSATSEPTEVNSTMSEVDVRQWLAAGQEIGNHTFDHPMLDQCRPDEVRRQIADAHELLRSELGLLTTLFAWPNGNRNHVALPVLRSLGYQVVVNFDHKLCRSRTDHYDVPRLRVDSTASTERLAGIVSGAHPAMFAMSRVLGRGAK